MKKTIAILAVVLTAASVTISHAATPGVNLKINGGSEDDVFRVTISDDGRTYDIESNVALEADSSICWPAEAPPPGKFELHCKATAIAGFEIFGGGGDNLIELARVPVPATLSAGTGADALIGGSAADMIIGGSGKDHLIGNGGDDELRGEAGDDRVVGGPGNDRLKGGGGNDGLYAGAGNDALFGGGGADRLNGSLGDDLLVGGSGYDVMVGGPGRNVLRP